MRTALRQRAQVGAVFDLVSLPFLSPALALCRESFRPTGRRAIRADFRVWHRRCFYLFFDAWRLVHGGRESMRKALLALVSALCLALLVGCPEEKKNDKKDKAKDTTVNKDAKDKHQEASDKLKDAKEKTKDAAKDAADAIKAKREAYAAEMQPKLDMLNDQISALEKKAKDAKGDAKTKMDKTIADL